MARGKQTCKILKEIRRQIAEANDIEFVTSECRYKGDCLGTCPKCEAEVQYLEQQLRMRQLADLHIIDENKKTLPYENVTIERIYLDEDSEEDADYLDPVWIEEKGVFRIYWNEDSDFQDGDGKPLKEAVLRIKVDGYDKPKTIKVKYPKRNTKKTIKFKHEKK